MDEGARPISKTYHGTPRTCYTHDAGNGESVSVSSAAALVYSRASDDNVHAALNLPLLPPPVHPADRSLSFLSLHYIIFHPFRRSFLRVASPCSASFTSVFFIFIFSSSSSSSSSDSSPSVSFPLLSCFVSCIGFLFSTSTPPFYLFFSPCSYFMRAGVSSPSGRTLPRITRNARDRAVRRTGVENECLCTDN